jgi:N-acetylneuraminate synthase
VKNVIKIGSRNVGQNYPAYLIAEIGSNFDGSLERAKHLVDLAVDCGADAAKFQTFRSETIINKEAFRTSSSFQAKWGRSVWDVYKDAEFPFEWHKEISDYCASKHIDFLTSPYDFEAIEMLERLNILAYKIGSGEITNLEFLKYVAEKSKPVILSCGAATMGEISDAVKIIRSVGNNDIILLQCVTMYPAPFEDANIRAMCTLREAFDCLVGYSDHTPGNIVPLGAVALGGCVIEKHFTDDKKRKGPDHLFAMDVDNFKELTNSIRTLELAMGSPVKDVYPCESETVILQRRSIFAAKNIPKGTTITPEMITVLRPQKGLLPKYKPLVLGRVAKVDIIAGEPITWEKV